MKRHRPRFDYDAIPPDQQDGTSSFVHAALIFTGRLSEVPAWAAIPLWAAIALGLRWAWGGGVPGLVAGGGFAVCIALDWAMLGLLPVARRSWGPVTSALLGLGVVHGLIFGAGALVARLLGPATPGGSISLVATLVANLALSATAFYATWIEPFALKISRQSHPAPGWTDGAPVRVLHLSDLHYEGDSPRERRVLEALARERPHLLLLTGDYLNLSSVYDPVAQAGARQLLARLLHTPTGGNGTGTLPAWPPAPIAYAVTGSPVVDVEGIVPEVFAGLPIRWLDDEAVPAELGDRRLWLLGVRTTYDYQRDAAALGRLAAETPEEEFRILLYHTPDLMPVAADLGIDLYLCGHTHGGQLRMPFYGAVATSSRWGKRYEQGRYREGRTTLYISRGLGVEGLGAPRARFLAPPELIVWEFSGAGSAER